MIERETTNGGPTTNGLLTDVAIVHDYFNQRGGAERVALELADMFPSAPLYTSLYRSKSTFPEFAQLDVRTTFLDRIPVDHRFRALLPLYLVAFRSLGALEAQLVISSSSGWAHVVRTAPRSLHAAYCHTPARWLYGDYMGASHGAAGVGAVRERVSAHGPAQQQAGAGPHPAALWPRSTIVYPPTDVDRFTPSPRGQRLLAVSRLMPYKRVDLIVDPATQTGISLDGYRYGGAV